MRRQAEVDELQWRPDVLARFEDPILELEVAVADFVLVEVLDAS